MTTATKHVQEVRLSDAELKLPSADILEKFVSELEERYKGPITGYHHCFFHWLSPGIPVVPDAPARLRQVAAIVDKDPSCLNMQDWHTCGTTHCIAGWAVHLVGTEMRDRLHWISGRQTAVAGTMLLGHEAACYFYDIEDDTAARAFLKRQLYPA